MPDKNDPSWSTYAAYGFEVAIGVVLGYFIGHWLGNKYHWGIWGDFGGVMIGCAAGMYALVKEALRTNKK
jgi:F0F1-type ATP synthase assembly protein I